MPDYSKGKIYIIQNTKNEKVYIGSTIKTLKQRFSNHITGSSINKQSSMTEPIKTIGREHFNIELLEEFPCNSKTELENIENFWIGFFIGFVGRDNVYNDKVDGINSNNALERMRTTLKQRKVPDNIKKQISLSTRGIKNHAFNRGCISLKNENSYRYTWRIEEQGELKQKEKSFNFKKYGGEENALKEAEKFRDTMFPPN